MARAHELLEEIAHEQNYYSGDIVTICNNLSRYFYNDLMMPLQKPEQKTSPDFLRLARRIAGRSIVEILRVDNGNILVGINLIRGVRRK